MSENNPIVGLTDSVVDVVQPEPVIRPSEADVRSEPAAHGERNGVVARPVDAVRAAAGRLGARRVQELARLGREYEREHGLKPGRQRRKQLIQLGRRYEVEKGLRAPKPRRRRKGDAWVEFLNALARVIKPAHRPALESLVAALQQSKVIAQAA